MIEKGKIDQERYFALENYANYSLIKRVAESGNRAFLTLKETPAALQKTMDKGHILERFFLESEDTSYIRIDKSDKLTGHSDKLAKALISYCKENDIRDITNLNEEILIDKIVELNLWSNTKNPDILLDNASKVLPTVKFQISLKEGDVIADPDIFNLLAEAKEGMFSHPNVVEELTPVDADEVYNQYTVLDDESFIVPTKVRLDRVAIDRKKKRLHITDFKTTEEAPDNFLIAFYKYKYYYQLPFYSKVFLTVNPEFRDYELIMKFLVISKTFPKVPVVYNLPNVWIDKAWNGWKNKTGYKIKGINELLEEIKWYWDFGSVEKSYNVAKNNNILTIEEDWNE